jgi:putative SOS response-associated peptidase YedK
MCNLYSITTNQAAIITPVPRDQPLCRRPRADAGRVPDYPAPVVRNTDAGTEMVTMRWGMPPPPRTGRTTGHQHPQHLGLC